MLNDSEFRPRSQSVQTRLGPIIQINTSRTDRGPDRSNKRSNSNTDDITDKDDTSINASMQSLISGQRNSRHNSQSSQDSSSCHSQLSSPGPTALKPLKVPPSFVLSSIGQAQRRDSRFKGKRRQSCFETLLAERYLNHATHADAKLTPSLSDGLRRSNSDKHKYLRNNDNNHLSDGIDQSVNNNYETCAQFIESVRREFVNL